jgi:ribonuclease HI
MSPATPPPNAESNSSLEAEVIIHADESCLGNQFVGRDNPGGAGGLVELRSGDNWVQKDIWVSERATTNNRMALRSAIVSLQALERTSIVRFVSDSEYLVKGMKEWLPGWKARGWRRKGGKIENLDLWQELDSIAARHSLIWEWVRGHAGHPRNEYANELATRAAANQSNSQGLVESGFAEWSTRGKRVPR